MKYIRILQVFKRAFFPPKCLVCGSFFSAEHNPSLSSSDPSSVFLTAFSPFICSSCLELPSPVGPVVCTLCGEGFVSSAGGDHMCGRCISDPPPLTSARSMGKFEGLLRALVHQLKYNDGVYLAKPLALWMGAYTASVWPGVSFDIVIPVPLHPRRCRSRGYNQSRLICNHMASEPLHRILMNKKILRRVHHTPTQTGLNRKERRKNMRDAFDVKNKHLIAGRRILLVDDVWTTGATASACAGVLKKAGALEVYVLTLARAPLS